MFSFPKQFPTTTRAQSFTCTAAYAQELMQVCDTEAVLPFRMFIPKCHPPRIVQFSIRTCCVDEIRIPAVVFEDPRYLISHPLMWIGALLLRTSIPSLDVELMHAARFRSHIDELSMTLTNSVPDPEIVIGSYERSSPPEREVVARAVVTTADLFPTTTASIRVGAFVLRSAHIFAMESPPFFGVISMAEPERISRYFFPWAFLPEPMYSRFQKRNRCHQFRLVSTHIDVACHKL